MRIDLSRGDRTADTGSDLGRGLPTPRHARPDQPTGVHNSTIAPSASRT
ncbi:MAG: hypothetical protein QOK16_4369 [Solirubrobacteraceae bacterium]|jgi:hypothetical protein|nr:hypothetical protein [Solirubrobacteraceae bacterium]MEA2183404.1 hypothetical protein [Solirubrobacteraceae bacterium]MEA2189358.1 hypothetical protein [Solirubrobacteraceae bacterium]